MAQIEAAIATAQTFGFEQPADHNGPRSREIDSYTHQTRVGRHRFAKLREIL
jgi:hypothetical protein